MTASVCALLLGATAVPSSATPAAASVAAPAAVPVNYLRAAAGDSQHVAPGQQVAQDLTARALDSDFRPVEGAVITFTTPGDELTFPGGATTATAVTDADGRAVAPALTAGSAQGAFLVTAATEDQEARVSFEIIID
ncbi:hypothetical protein FQU76_12195 [Streptomyces qinzhouensis]|uniref:Big-1 domain-containing protein n=1 Tax=Streptomyces qinzhouensis TaxID=2599401 RepID=A0A5B8JM38_9ACTN|nr:hypothetical protein FQU76_12195 [Streptomyces qinzhouensis]